MPDMLKGSDDNAGMPMDDAEIETARAVIAAATRGPWQTDKSKGWPIAYVGDGAYVATAPMPGEAYASDGVKDAAFIAAARTGWPKALDALVASRAERDQWKQKWSDLRDMYARSRNELEEARAELAEARALLAEARDMIHHAPVGCHATHMRHFPGSSARDCTCGAVDMLARVDTALVRR